MYKLPDEEFDRLCREAADQPEVDLPIQGWEKMRQRLDREMPEERGRRRAWPFWIPFMLFLPFSLFYWKNQAGESLTASTAMVSGTAVPGTTHDRTPAGLTLPEQGSPVQGSPDQGSPETGFPEQSTAKPFAQHPSSPDPSVGNPLLSERTLPSQIATDPSTRNQPSSERTLPRLHAPDPSARERASQKPSTPKQASPDPFTGSIPGGSVTIEGLERSRPVDPQKSSYIPPQQAAGQLDTTLRRSTATPSNTAMTSDGSREKGIDQLNTNSIDSARNGADRQKQPGPGLQPSGEKSLPAKPVPTAQRGFGISLVAGPDWSNVQFSAPDKVGLMAGITIQYRLNRRWVIQSGLMYSRKHYTAAGEGRASYPGYDPNNPAIKMKKVQANCFMWDIPLNLRFDILAGDRRKFYALLGFSSYLMGREDLHYYYTWNNAPRYRGWENPVDKMYWFSEANLAIGYEHQLGRQWSVKLEPFLKLPIQAVGSGQVNLTSLGALAGLTYTPRFRSSSTIKK